MEHNHRRKAKRKRQTTQDHVKAKSTILLLCTLAAQKIDRHDKLLFRLTIKKLRKPDKYLPEKQTWYLVDNFHHCQKPVIQCPKCQHSGHISEHLNQTRNQKMQINNKTGQMELHIQRDFYIHHSHFIADLDKGRHVRCKIGSDHLPVSDPQISTMYRLRKSRHIPDWVNQELNE